MSLKPILAAARQRPAYMEVLRLLPPYTVADVTNAHKELARRLHPDAGGDPDAFKALQSAYERALDHARFQESRRDWLGQRVERYQQRLELIARIERLGGVCTLQPVDPYLYDYGEDFAEILRRLVGVEMSGPAVNDASLQWMRPPNPALAEIRALDLRASRVTDAGLTSLGALEGLRCLDLRQTDISATTLDQLPPFAELEWLHVGDTSAGALARWRLRRRMPRLTIATRLNEVAPPAEGSEFEHHRLQRRLSELGMLP